MSKPDTLAKMGDKDNLAEVTLRGAQVSSLNQHPRTSKTRAWMSKAFLRTLCLLTLVYVILVFRNHWPTNEMKPPAKQRDDHLERGHFTNADLNYTKRELLHFDINQPPFWPISDSVSIAESLDICRYSWNATGTLKVVRGEPEQEENFMIGISVAATSQMALDSVIWPMRDDGKGLFIRCVEFPGISDDEESHWDASVQMDVTVFVKPNTLQFGKIAVSLDALDIEIAEGLKFETYYMDLYTTQGNVVGVETDGFTAHEISVTSRLGSITGNWSLPSAISLQTGIGEWRPEGGPIDIELIPKRWSSGPTTAGVLSALTIEGDIDIRTPLHESALSLRNSSIDIHSLTGSISGTFVTGIHTSLTTLAGSINATLLPYFALPVTSNVITSAGPEDVSIKVLPPVIDSYYQINPLTNTKSEHSVTSGTLSLEYPSEWVGAVLGLSELGHVSISGTRLQLIESWEHTVVARTDAVIASRLDFSTTTGDGELRIM